MLEVWVYDNKFEIQKDDLNGDNIEKILNACRENYVYAKATDDEIICHGSPSDLYRLLHSLARTWFVRLI